MRIKYPLILINFKTYLESQGSNALALSKASEKVGEEYGVCIAVAPQFMDAAEIVKKTGIPVFSQHSDPETPGSHTGSITPESLKEAGLCGTLLNHSERRLRADIIEETVTRCRSLGLFTCVCANTPAMGRALAAFEPDMIAVEPPELIGSGVSVSKAKPEVIANSVKMVKEVSRGNKVHVLCGAGVTTGEDVAVALKLGAEGILVASGVVKAKNPEAVLRDFALRATRL